MTERSILLLHGIRGARLGYIRGHSPELVWELNNEQHPERHLMALHLDDRGWASPLHEGPRLQPVDLEPSVYGSLAAEYDKRLVAWLWDWRLAPEQAVQEMSFEPHVEGQIDVIAHSMGLHLLCELLQQGRIRIENIRRLVLAAAPFGGSLDILHVLRQGCDRASKESDEGQYGALVRSFPALYHLLPVPGYGLIKNDKGLEPDFLHPDLWPDEFFGEQKQYRAPILGVLAGARKQRKTLTDQVERLGQLGDRALVLCASGAKTPDRLTIPTTAGGDERLTFSQEGDGRLPLRCQLPREFAAKHSFTRHVIGSEEYPADHGELLERQDVLDCIREFLA